MSSDEEARKFIGRTKGGVIAALAAGIVIFGGMGFLAQSPESSDNARGGNGFTQMMEDTKKNELEVKAEKKIIEKKISAPSEELITMNETDTSAATNSTDNDQ